MKTLITAVRSIGVRRGLDNSAASGQAPVTGREGQPRTGTRLARWAAVLTLAIALAPGAASAQDDDTVTISGVFSMDGEFDLYYVSPELLAVYYNGYEHTWTLTLHGTTQTHRTNGSYYGTEIHATSFELEFFGPDAATLNSIVSDHLAEQDVYAYLQNTYYENGGGLAIMHVGVGHPWSGYLYFYSGHDIGVDTLFPADADGYPVVGPDPFSINPDYTELAESDLFSGTYAGMWSLAGPVTFEGNVGMGEPDPGEPVVIAVSDASVLEGDRGTSKVAVPVTLSRSSNAVVTVNYATANGTALARKDYTETSGTLTIPPGQTQGTITVAIKGDRKREPDEVFYVELLDAVGATIGDAVATVTILNDD